jgi:hypothetical protein
MRRTACAIALVAGLASGCYVESDVEYPYVSGPDLAYVEPGVEVVVGYDHPVFFVDGLYWLWWGDVWYASPYWNHGWYRPHAIPPRLNGMPRPHSYAHFRPLPANGTRRAPGYTTQPSPGHGSHPTHFVAPSVHASTSHGGHR